MSAVRLRVARLLAGTVLLMAGSCAYFDPSPAPAAAASILLFNGTGTSPGDVDAFERILEREHLAYTTVSSRRLNAMSAAEIRAYRLLIIPGGNFIHIGQNLTPGTAANVRTAVIGGLNYLGVCAGALLAGNSPYNGLNLTSGLHFGFYQAVNRGIHKTVVAVSSPSGPVLDQYWEDGPQLTGWGTVVARYPDGTAAVTQGPVGRGWVVLSGVHPEAPDTWRRGMAFRTPASADNAYAAMLIRSAFGSKPLPHF